MRNEFTAIKNFLVDIPSRWVNNTFKHRQLNKTSGSAPASGDRGKHCGIKTSGCSAAVARLLWEQEVASSILATPTNYILPLL